MMSLRLKEFIENQEKSVSFFEKNIGASNGVIRHAIINNSDIQSKWIAKICEKYPQLSMEWLITGRGEMLKSNSKNVSMQARVEGNGKIHQNVLGTQTINDQAEKIALLEQIVASQKETITQQKKMIQILERKKKK